MAWLRRNPATALLALALLASAALLLVIGRDLTYFQDSWAFLLERQGSSADDFLRPHNEHISLISVAVQKLLLATFGMGSDLPERIVLTAMLAATAVLLFVYVRRRTGPWPALFAATILLFLGPAWEVLLWSFEISLAGSVLAGLGMLLALDRGDRRGDLAACLLLAIAIGFSSLGIPFLAAALADVAQRHCRRGWARLYVPGAPLALYLAWFVAYGRESESAASLHSALHAPVFVVEGIASSLAAILGLPALAGGIESQQRPYLGLLALLAVLALAAYALWRAHRSGYRPRLPRPAPGIWPVLAATLAFWGLAGLNDLPGRAPWASRYMHVGAIFVFLLAANLLARVSIPPRALRVAAGVTAIVVALNMIPLFEGRDRLERESELARAELAAIEIARYDVDPEFWLSPDVAGTSSLVNVGAGRYLRAIERYGSPAYTPAELAAAPPAARRQADIVLAAALPVETKTAFGPVAYPRARCADVRPAAPRSELRLRPGTTLIAVPPGRPASIALRRYTSDEYPVSLDDLPGGSVTRLRVPPDRSPRPWRMRVQVEQGAEVCGGA